MTGFNFPCSSFFLNCNCSGMFSISALWKTSLPKGRIPFVLWFERVTVCSPLRDGDEVVSPLRFQVQSMLMPGSRNLEDGAFTPSAGSRCALPVVCRRQYVSCVHLCTLWGSRWNPIILRKLPGNIGFPVISAPPICK